MSKMKKLAALVLALAMSLSLMAVTAAAYGAEGHVHDETCAADTVQPRKPAKLCPGCQQEMEGTVSGSGDDRVIIFKCRACKITIEEPW